MRVRCKTCLGEYDTVSADEVRYVHVCGPLRFVTVRRVGGLVVDVPALEQLPTDVWLGDRFEERPDKRDENAVPVEGKPGAIRSDGKGIEILRA